jgi:hypothetical protein
MSSVSPLDNLKINAILGSKLGIDDNIKGIAFNKNLQQFCFLKNYKKYYGCNSQLLNDAISFLELEGIGLNLLNADMQQQLAVKTSNVKNEVQGAL